MEVVILAGGRGRRLGAISRTLPKPLVRIGDEPILWHVIMHFVQSGFYDITIATGYLGHLIEDYIGTKQSAANMRVVDTGLDTATGGRLRRLAPMLKGGTFMMAWADAVTDIDVAALTAFHRRHRRLATVTAVHPPARFGRLFLNGDRVTRFSEKQIEPTEWINGAYFVLEPEVIDYIEGDDVTWESAPMQRMVEDDQLMAYRHDGFWQCADTVDEFDLLNRYWDDDIAPWRIQGS